jgi:hypothetical protein
MKCQDFILLKRLGKTTELLSHNSVSLKTKTKLHGLSLRPSDRRLSAKLVPNFADKGCHVVSVTDPYGRILGFLGRMRYFFFQVAPQLYSRGSVDSVPDILFLRKFGSAGNRTRTSGSVAWNSDTRPQRRSG